MFVTCVKPNKERSHRIEKDVKVRMFICYTMLWHTIHTILQHTLRTILYNTISCFTSRHPMSPHLRHDKHVTLPQPNTPHFTTPQLTLPHLTSPYYNSLQPTTPHPTSPHHTRPHLTLPYLTLPHLTSPHLTSPHLTSPHLTSPHLTSPHLTSPHLTSPHLTSPHLTALHHTLPYLITPNFTLTPHTSVITPHFTLPYLTAPHLTSLHYEFLINFIIFLVINTSCPRAKAERINWPRANFGVVSVHKCPYGAQGTARRLCAFGKGWQDPDLSNCTSRGFVNIVKSVSHSEYEISLSVFVQQ